MRRPGLAIAALALAACNSVLGFDDAREDPGLTVETNATEALTCSTYCDAIMKNCTGEFQEYLTPAICEAMCPHFELGVPNVHDDDSLACRLYHAKSAAQSPAIHCRHAGPTGGGHCGPQPCDAFCLLDVALCNGPLLQYPGGEAECRTECAKYTYSPDPSVGELTQTSGDSLECRLWHLESAYDPDNPVAKTTHCPHTAKASATCSGG